MSKYTLWKIFLVSAALQMLGSFLYFVILTNEVAIQITYFITKGLMLAAPMALVLASFDLPKFTLKPNIRSSLVLGLGTGLAIAGLMLGTYAAFANYFSQFGSTIATKVNEIGILSIYWPVVIAISLLHSLFEEYYVRWYLVKGFETHLSPLSAILVGNAIFTLHHYIILSQFVSWPLVIFFGTMVGVGGIVWSLIYQRTGSLLGAWISHACADIAIFVIGYVLIAH